MQSVTGFSNSLAGRIVRRAAGPLAQMPTRVRLSFADQMLISGVNALTGIILVRWLGLHEFGIYSMILIGVQFLAVPQGAAILAPMMSLFDQRGDVSRSSYLAALLMHQALYAAVAVALVGMGAVILGPEAEVDFLLVAAVVVATQFQDLARRFFYVTERPFQAFFCDVIAYGGRLAAVLAFAFSGDLTIDLVWVVMIVASAAALLVLTPDLSRLDFTWQPIANVTRSHQSTAGWMLGNSVVGLFADNNFVMLVIGSVLGPAQLGAVRAVQTVALVLNLLNLSLENFVPSAATRSLMNGGHSALLGYVARVSFLGVAGISAVVVLLLLFADPIMEFLYGRTFSDQLPLIVAFGAYSALAHIAFVITAGLRALNAVHLAFLPQALLSAASLVIAFYAVDAWGIVGALFALLGLRLLFTAQLAFTLRARAAA